MGVDAAHTTRRRTLGQIMLDEGMLRQDQLDLALAQQRESDRPLGEVLVGLGFVSPGAVANVLAEQHGGLLKTEYGLSTGLHGSASPAPAAAKREPTPQPAPAPTPDPAPPEPAVADDLLERWRDAVAERDRLLVQLGQTVREQTAELEELRRDRAAATERSASVVDELERLRAEASTAAADLAGVRAELVAARAEVGRTRAGDEAVAELQKQTANAAAKAQRLAAQLEQRDARIGELEAALAAATADPEPAGPDERDERDERIAELEGALAAATAEPEPEPPAAAHLVFFGGPEGWELAERTGPAPARGSVTPDGVVVRLGPSPLPGDSRACAFVAR